MQTEMLRARAMLLAPMLLAVMGCVASPPISAPPPPCLDLIPDSWREPVAHAPMPATSPDPLVQLKNWIAFGTAEAGQLEKANGRMSDTLAIDKRCQARDRAAIKASKPKFLGLF